jgi:hypothetical protein
VGAVSYIEKRKLIQELKKVVLRKEHKLTPRKLLK